MRHIIWLISLFSILFSQSQVVWAGGGDTTRITQKYAVEELDSGCINRQIDKIRTQTLQNPDSTYIKTIALLEASKKINYQKGIADAYVLLGGVWGLRLNQEKAVAYMINAINIYEEIGDENGLAKAYIGMGNTFSFQKNYKKAIEIYGNSLEIAKKNNKHSIIVTNYINISHCLIQIGQYQEALKIVEDARKIIPLLDDNKFEDILFINKAIALGNLGRDAEAFELLKKVEISSLEKGNKITLLEAYQQINIHLLKKNNVQEAEIYLKKFEHLAFTLNVNESKFTSQKLFSELYEKKGDLKKSLFYVKRYVILKDSADDALNLDFLARMQADFETVKKNREYEHLKVKNISQGKEIERVNSSNALLIVFLVFLLFALIAFSVLLFLFFKNNQKKKKQYEQIELQKQAIQEYADDLKKANEAIAEQKTKLEEKNSAIEKLNNNLELLVTIRTSDLEQKNQKIVKYADFNAHKLRAPVATMKGLVRIFKLVENPVEKALIISKISDTSDILDKVIHEIQDIIDSGHDDTDFVIRSE